MALNGETYVVSVNEFSAMCNWQVIGVQVEQNQCKARTWRNPLRWDFQELVSLPVGHVYPKRQFRSSRPTSRVNQYGILLLSL